MVKQTALASGVPHERFLFGSREVAGSDGVDAFFEPLLEALVKSLTEQEKESGWWEPPPEERVLFEGTLDEAESFYQQTKDVFWTGWSPISIYTDGLPIRVPTEERVQEMLAGTSHKSDELITLQTERTTWRGETMEMGAVVQFSPMNYTATVEKVAINAVMAGCKPEYFPVVLAIAESGCGTGTTVFWSQWVCVSGPIAKVIGMNTGTGMFDPGSQANGSIGRAYQLMSINLGGAIPGINRMNSIGSPFNTGGTCIAENAEGLPPGWKGLNEEHGFKKSESVAMVMNTSYGIQGGQFSPGGYRALQKSGHGGMARRLGVKGKPGPHNWLEYLIPGLWTNSEGSKTFIMAPRMAKHLYDYGFKSKEAIYEWLWKKSHIPVKEWKNYSWPDFFTNGGLAIEETSGKRWRDLPDDYMVPALGREPFDNCIIVGGGPDEVCLQLSGRRNFGGSYPIYSIDVWR